MKKVLLLMLLLTGYLWSAEAVSPFKVIAQSPQQIKVRFTLPEFALADTTVAGYTCQKLVGKGSLTGRAGYPQLWQFAANIGLPADGALRVQVTGSRTFSRDNILLAPAGEENLTVENTDPYFDTAAYASTQAYPVQIATVGRTAFLGDRHFGTVQVCPLQYIAAQKKLVVYKQIDLLITISGSTGTRSLSDGSNYMDKLGDDFFLNNQTSKYWRKARVRDPHATATRSQVVEDIQFVVDKEGIYKITRQDILEALANYGDYSFAFDIRTVDPRHLELYDKNGPVPIRFSGERDGRWDEGDYLEFWGEPHKGNTGYMDERTARNVYQLKVISATGTRMSVENGGLQVNDTGNYYSPTSYQQTVHFEEQDLPSTLTMFGYNYETTIPDSLYREDLFYWTRVQAPNMLTMPVQLEYPTKGSTERFSVTTMLTGETYPAKTDPSASLDHHVSVRFNDCLVGESWWRGQFDRQISSPENSINLPNTSLANGTNYFYLSLPGDTYKSNNERVFLDWFELTYWREYRTDRDYLSFTKPATRPAGLYQFALYNFSSPDVSVYKIGASYLANLQIEAFNENQHTSYTVTFQDSVISNSIRYYAVTEAQKLKPVLIRPDLPSNLKSTVNASQYVIITSDRFRESDYLNQWRDLWQERGINTQVVFLQDIYDEFNFGIASTRAIQDFLRWAYNNWGEPRLSSVLLLGDGVSMIQDNSSLANLDVIPTRRILAPESFPMDSDTWYACIVGDDILPDLQISRVCVNSEEQIGNYLTKLRSYLEDPGYDDFWVGKATLVAGGTRQTDGDDFARQCERMRKSYLDDAYNIQRVFSYNTLGYPNTGRAELRQSFNSNTSYVQFMGHGGSQIWSDNNLLNYNDVHLLANNRYPLVVSLSCYSGNFGSNTGNLQGTNCIGEALITEQGRGAIAHFGLTGFAWKENDETLGGCILDGLFVKRVPTLGEAINYALAKYYGAATEQIPMLTLIRGSNLMGDPLLAMQLPSMDATLNLTNYNMIPGETATITTSFAQPTTLARVAVCNTLEQAVNAPTNEIDQNVANNQLQYDYTVPSNSTGIFTRKIRVMGAGPDGASIGITSFSVGSSAINYLGTIPAQPTVSDSVFIKAQVFDNDGIRSVTLRISSTVSIPMVPSEQDENVYITSHGLEAISPGTSQAFTIVVVDNLGNSVTSSSFQFTIAGIDLVVSNMELLEHNNIPAFRILVQNLGNLASPASNAQLYWQNTHGTQPTLELISSVSLPALEPMGHTLVWLPLTNINGAGIKIVASVNTQQTFLEYSMSNNSEYFDPTDYNYVLHSNQVSTLSSFDGNFTASLPAGLVSPQAFFALETLTGLTPHNQDGAVAVPLFDNSTAKGYRLRCLSPALLADSLGYFGGNRAVTLTFNYHTDSTTEAQAAAGMAVYRWEPDYQKWVYQGGQVVQSSHQVIYLAKRTGIYGLWQKTDSVLPSIEANVEGQEFTYGGYVSSNGTISLLFSDANGIDIFDHNILLYLNGEQLDKTKYSQLANPDHLYHVPVKYQLDLQAGSYTLTACCTDVNGNYAERDINFLVNTTFGVRNLANYPNPVVSKTVEPVNEGRTRFTYVLDDDADDVILKVFTVSGRLVKTFRDLPTGVGYHEYPRTLMGWDVRDEQGYYLANGVYFYKLIAHKGDRSVEKIQKMAVTK